VVVAGCNARWKYYPMRDWELTPRPQVYAILDEVFLAGEIEETSKQVVLDRLDYLEKLE
jgi:hypothetical protein